MHLQMEISFFKFSMQFGFETYPTIVLVKTSNQYLSQHLTGMYRSFGIYLLQIVFKSSIRFMFDAPRLPSAVFRQYGLLYHAEPFCVWQ